MVLVVISFAGCKQQTTISIQQDKNAPAPAGDVGSRMPDFTIRDLDGNEISSADLSGKVALIDFWATWCKPCEKEMPGYQKLADRYGSHGFVVIGLKLDTIADSQDPRAFARKIGVRYPLAVATEALKRKFGGIEALPTAMIYDREGVLRAKVVGFEYKEVIESTIKPLLRQAPEFYCR